MLLTRCAPTQLTFGRLCGCVPGLLKLIKLPTEAYIKEVKAYIHQSLHQSPPSVKCNIYKALVCPKLEYSSTVWCDPQTSSNINCLEAVQRSMCLNIFPDTKVWLQSWMIPSLQSRRFNLLKNSLAVKKVWPFLNSQSEKSCEIEGGSQEMAVIM